MDYLEKVIVDITEVLDNKEFQKALSSSIPNAESRVIDFLSSHSDIVSLSREVEKVKKEVVSNLDYYIEKAMNSLKSINGIPHYAEDKDEAISIIDKIIGNKNKIILSKSMVAEEIGLRNHLESLNKEVWETDIGQLLIQLENGKPMHATAPAIHMTVEEVMDLLKNKLHIELNGNETPQQIVAKIRPFLREKFVNAEIGISGANAISADTGSIFLIENEGNIRLVTTFPPIHIVIAGVEKIVPTILDAFKLIIVQSSFAGLYPPTYVSVVSGPSSTGDIGHRRVYGAHGPIEMHLILLDNGRKSASKNEFLKEQLRCIRCGYCQFVCPVWDQVANTWGGSVYGGPMGVVWTAITEGIEKGAELSQLCLGCMRCDVACPVEIPISNILHYLKVVYNNK
ncbi:MAG: LUD domain-containing protein [Caldisphaera sp.]|jgi:L-lactate dehydrogenase complex protein LldG|nr:lactate utilization protein B [Caldisphaera sp.]PMP60498.1 MAG: (Fe-S)-binding protein [Caldisphaera sp.]PMP90513.1 MAG: (Fe-S)-binding protein [Caldisphaera sp.]